MGDLTDNRLLTTGEETTFEFNPPLSANFFGGLG